MLSNFGSGFEISFDRHQNRAAGFAAFRLPEATAFLDVRNFMVFKRYSRYLIVLLSRAIEASLP
jgi:hypothetical protein